MRIYPHDSDEKLQSQQWRSFVNDEQNNYFDDDNHQTEEEIDTIYFYCLVVLKFSQQSARSSNELKSKIKLDSNEINPTKQIYKILSELSWNSIDEQIFFFVRRKKTSTIFFYSKLKKNTRSFVQRNKRNQCHVFIPFEKPLKLQLVAEE